MSGQPEVVRVLVVDDEVSLARTLGITLKTRGYEVELAHDGRTALALAHRQPHDLVILDMGLPDMDGADVIAGLRDFCRTPIIVLSARHAGEEKVNALDAGADDYVTKPFDMDELLARMRVAMRRAVPAAEDSPTISTAAFDVDLFTKRVLRHGEEVRLTPTEWHLLELLARNPGQLISGETLLREVWGAAYVKETQYLRVYFAQLRRKLEDTPQAPRHLVTEPGRGYRLVTEQTDHTDHTE
ncbi:response regulator transcription factor [Micrococcales bacterium 31B]|nr:response regulator transcription factor [Micrococcales bacterium 31B]